MNDHKELTHSVAGGAPTPEVDKVFDMISDREQPDGGRWGDTPSKWSYEAVLDLTDFARKMERERDAARAAYSTSGATNKYEGGNLHHWWERAIKAEAELAAALLCN